MRVDQFRRNLQGDAEIDKVPGENVTYSIDWLQQLLTGEDIATSEWAASPQGLTLSQAGVYGTTATVRIAGGVAGITYVVTNTITKTPPAGDEIPRSFLLHVRSRLS